MSLNQTVTAHVTDIVTVTNTVIACCLGICTTTTDCPVLTPPVTTVTECDVCPPKIVTVPCDVVTSMTTCTTESAGNLVTVVSPCVTLVPKATAVVPPAVVHPNASAAGGVVPQITTAPGVIVPQVNGANKVAAGAAVAIVGVAAMLL